MTLLLSLVLLSTGCIREDNSECLRGLYICFAPENPKHDYPGLVRTVDLYFYNYDGDLVAAFDYSKEGLRPGDRAAFVEKIPSGKYILVSIINDIEHYRTMEKLRLDKLQSYLDEEVLQEHLVDFFSGIMELTVKNEPLIQEVRADIFKHNNDIHLHVVYDGYELQRGSTLESYIDGNDGAYEHLWGTCPPNSYVKYLPYHTEEDENGLTTRFDFTVMRLWRESDLTIHLEENTPMRQIVHSIDLNIADALAKIVSEEGEYLYDTDKELSFYDDYKIVITLGEDFVILDITINDWSVIGGGVGV